MIPLDRIRAAQARLAGQVHRTPLLASQSLDEVAGATVRFKAENLQKTGSFKARGATNRVALAAEAGVRGVVTASSGNHGQAVAYAARRFGLSCHVVVPVDANPAKLDAVRAFGATVEFCGTTSRERLERAAALAAEQDLLFVPPYDDPDVMAGQGTVGVEILEQWPEVEVVVVPVGGGGLIAGIASAVKAVRPDVQVVGVEPAGAASSYLSRQAGRRMELPVGLSIADGLRSVSPGELTFPIIQEAVDELVTVTDEQIRSALWTLLARLKVLVEPSGACAAAWVLDGRRPLAGRRAAVVLSGGNVDAATLARLLSA
jgi:threonine dehydratase